MIEMRHVTKRFEKLEAVRDITLHIEKAEVVCLIGPSGSGKSTLLRCICGLEIPEAGEVLIQGETLDFLPKGKASRERMEKMSAKMGFVFQQFNLFPHMTAIQNLTLAPVEVLGLTQAEAEQRGEELLARVGLSEKRDSYPAQLSGGQKQRVAIARALAMEPAIMLFDEPTSALDPEMVGEVLEVMGKLAASGMTMLIVTHEMGFARKAGTRVLFLDEGRILEDAPPEQLFTAPQQSRTQEFLRKVIQH